MLFSTGVILVAHEAANHTTTISEYSASGQIVNAHLITAQSYVTALAVSGSDLFMAENNRIVEYTTAGVRVTDSLVGGLSDIEALAVSGQDLFVAQDTEISEYTTTGMPVNISLITGLYNRVGALAVSGSDLFVAFGVGGDTGASGPTAQVGEYTTSGMTVDADLLPFYGVVPEEIVVSGPDLLVSQAGQISGYTTSGEMLNFAPVSGYGDFASFGSDLLVLTSDNGIEFGITEYSMSGAPVNAALLKGLTGVEAIATAAPFSITPTFGRVELPHSVVAGTKLSAKVPLVITNHGADLTGDVTVSIFADTATVLDGNQVSVASLTRKVSLNTDKSVTFRFNIRELPRALAAGDYHLLAEVIDPSGIVSETATTQTVHVVTADIEPAAASLASVTPATVAVGRTGSTSIIVRNKGNVPASGIDVTLSPVDRRRRAGRGDHSRKHSAPSDDPAGQEQTLKTGVQGASRIANG